ncbi:hypothetical protein [Parageobacillus genomosp. 1]|uniref:hypothetical protein n=1 Tax=Parageobacillus genomosp. 1 TaxID=1295642 RepID=UPI000A8CDB43|nr:hypothetical protein [Parageobacillus genomosp. 1]
MKPLEIAGFINKQLWFVESSSAVKPDSSFKGSAGKEAAKKRGKKANGRFFVIS